MGWDLTVAIITAVTSVATWTMDKLGVKIPRPVYWGILIVCGLVLAGTIVSMLFHRKVEADAAPKNPAPTTVIATGNSGGQNGVNNNYGPVYNGPVTNPPPGKPLPVQKPSKPAAPITGNCIITGNVSGGHVEQHCETYVIAQSGGHTLHVEAGRGYEIRQQSRVTLEVEGASDKVSRILLPSDPQDGDEVSVNRQSDGAYVDVIGNGKKIKGMKEGLDDWPMNTDGESWTFHFDGEKWVVS